MRSLATPLQSGWLRNCPTVKPDSSKRLEKRCLEQTLSEQANILLMHLQAGNSDQQIHNLQSPAIGSSNFREPSSIHQQFDAGGQSSTGSRLNQQESIRRPSINEASSRSSKSVMWQAQQAETLSQLKSLMPGQMQSITVRSAKGHAKRGQHGADRLAPAFSGPLSQNSGLSAYQRSPPGSLLLQPSLG